LPLTQYRWLSGSDRVSDLRVVVMIELGGTFARRLQIA
jgi:hypothetical protein